ncbi:MAG: multidrug efflux pump [Lentisphaeria bacterium]|jgi:multidrug efflux pump
MNITAFSIKNSRFTLVLLAVIVFVGIQNFLSMPRAYDPGFIIRTAQVITHFPGASPARVEELVSAKIEKAVKEMPELDFVTSESRTGISIVLVNIKESYKNMRPIWDKLRRKVESVSGDLPSGATPPRVNDEFGDVFGVVFTLTGEGFSYAELKTVADSVRDDLQQLPDVAKVEIIGDQEERVFVEYDNSRLADMGISPTQLSQTISARNIVISGGSFNLGRERIVLEPSGNFESIEDIKHSIVRVPGSKRLVFLKDIASVSRDYVDPPKKVVMSSGQAALAIAVSMREGGNNIAMGEQVLGAIAQFERQYPWGLEFELINFSPREVDDKVKSFVSNLGQAVLVVTAVMLLSLGFRTGIIVVALIPISMLMTTIVMSLFDIGLDQISLAALIIALGMLVDNGIVMSESILVRLQQGLKPITAAVDSAMELRVPLLTASLTTSAAFLPIFLAESNVGEFTASLFKVVTITLMCSWIISLTVIPLLCVYFLKVTPKPQSLNGTFYRYYKKTLALLLKKKWATLSVTALVFIIAMSGFNSVPKLFFPASDRSYFKIELELPIGSTIEATQMLASDVGDYLAHLKADGHDIVNWISYVGSGGPRFVISHAGKADTPEYALLIVNVADYRSIATLMPLIQRYGLANHPDLEITQRRIENGPAVSNPVEVRLSSKNENALNAAVSALKIEMNRLGGLTNISDNWGQRIKKFDIHINQARALRAGVTSEDIAASLQAGLSGIQLTEYREGEDIIPVTLRSLAGSQNDINKVESLSVYAPSSGMSVPLAQVADVNVVWNTAKILRRNGVRTVTIGAQLESDITAVQQFINLQPWLDNIDRQWGGGVRYELGGESESSGKANRSIMDKLPLAGFIILLLLVAQFNSIRKPIIILATIPLGLIGVIGGLLLARSYFGFMTFLGIISLAGIVINNAIVLLERIQTELDGGREPAEAIVHSCVARMRPILLTTATTVLGLLPLYLGGGEMWEPMAVSIMAGLLFSTVLTLYVVPALYAVLYRVDTGKLVANDN